MVTWNYRHMEPACLETSGRNARNHQPDMTAYPEEAFVTRICTMVLLPLFFYLACFSALTYPLITRVATHYISDSGDWCMDAPQNIWNMWWVNKAVTELHQPVWQTNYLHYPHGSTLLGHTLNPFNGFAGIILQRFMTLPQAYNTMVIFSFIVGGWAAFYLAYLFSRSYAGSLLAGYIFTFSPFHFAHALGHLQLVSLEWIPLFIAAFYLFLDRPTVIRAAASALLLFLIILCDYYYAFYSMVTAVIIAGYWMWMKRDFLLLVRREYRRPMAVFAALGLVTTGALVGFFILAHRSDPFTGGHSVEENSMNLSSLVIYGGHWRFRELTRRFWEGLPPNPVETSVYLGFSVIAVLVYAWVKRRKIAAHGLGLWYFILLFFVILALGPVMRIGGSALTWFPLPYSALTYMFPLLNLSGCAMRMMVMVYLSAGVIAAMAYPLLRRGLLGSKMVLAVFVILLVLEYLPYPLSAQRARVPAYVQVFRALPPGAVADCLNDKYSAHYYQTLYERPRVAGYLSRYPASVERKYTEIDEVMMMDIPRYSKKLYDEYKLRYILTKPDYPPNPKLKLLYTDAECRIYELQP
ncbi:MAG: hypothetical protein NTX71_10540 [Candidatus Aureabacteria bacterium]|nr:hypothetical protein [Candidatus Auribacterota bacterium]